MLSIDVDECINGVHMCHENATCSNTNGSYTCHCISGWSGDGINCTSEVVGYFRYIQVLLRNVKSSAPQILMNVSWG